MLTRELATHRSPAYGATVTTYEEAKKWRASQWKIFQEEFDPALYRMKIKILPLLGRNSPYAHLYPWRKTRNGNSEQPYIKPEHAERFDLYVYLSKKK